MTVPRSNGQTRGGRIASSTLLALGVVLLAVSAAGVLTSEATTEPGRIALPGVARPAPASAAIEDGVKKAPEPVGEPGRLVIDAIGVNADFETIGLAADGTLTPPTEASRVGWYEGSARPGQKGPAVIVGHLDSVDGPAVFARLAELTAGDVVTVENGSGTALSFTVSTVARHPKRSFPTGAIYGALPDAELRLITCGGRYDRDSGYVDNVVVFARALVVAT